ncbi:helix-turn-helix transcriptional regulator [Sphingobacterium spiritivorum]|uniref:DNA-binding helix-turn-helix protein n=1 Tax=Sphingobacterium spiritivorum ATCC 33861 TaxID=525373 RepID=D7VL51_SPHSI|nr:helix-turn-helix transcriptional regulator [Sphingobacterium spiritivorum]EFK58324.1 DNA-binding helix-turn-helix protein [Sphingobacterium spiritivorum ATCC 33861]QQT37074.1 helix-turn-helix transcriptional regulator [Sphingobacterium spiritivorum]WQD33846.1 helix-turn-helix transcriptional regulator [Sphingobacterium spiritivorum]SUJ27477.1 Helix-turn-helix [Sphingobacterium spiritivorum]
MKNNIKINRVIKGYSQEQLAILVNVSRQTINALEAGKYVPSTVLSLKISQALDKSVEELFELDEGD